jgi:hypothetical protein
MVIVYNPNYLIADLSELISGTIMIISATVVMVKVRRESQSKFAYALMSLEAVLGLS